MNFASLLKAFDTALVVREAAKRFKDGFSQRPETGMAQQTPTAAQTGQLEARLTGVVVAALKEAFDRDHARLELERAQMDEQRRRAEEARALELAQIEEQRRRADEALAAELRRHAADRELGRLRLLAGTALIGWIASVVMLVARIDAASAASRIVMAVGWVLLLGALAAAFTAQTRVAASAASGTPLAPPPAAVASLWMLIAGLAAAAASLLF